MDENSLSEQFKKPLLPLKGPSSDSFKKSLIQISKDTEIIKESTTDDTGEKNVDSSIDDKSKIQNKKKTEKSQVNVPLPYKEPEWCGHPPSGYNIEIIKNGTYISTIPIKSSLVVFGRLDVCDIVFEHPSVSRYHAVIQFCKGDGEHPRGFYLYDLGSTHGTFLNKEKIKPNIYYKLKDGYILKFGGSSRLHIFQGHEEEEKTKIENQVANKVEPEDDICDWGMGEEALEEDDDIAENPFALSTNNEELYIEDPKKTLRGWFEREGYDLEYSVEEKGFRTFSCTVRLPVDNPTGEYLPVEASVGGKKKEAVIACALEACRTLDRLGLLRQSHQEGRQRKRKKWEENDFYDSDEDTFYDRTGEIEKRREMRKRLSKKVEVDNFQTIEVKLKTLNAEVEEIKSKISLKDTKDSEKSNSVNDPLDAYMFELSESSSTVSDKFERRKLKLRLIELEKEKVRLEKLSNIARPVCLPPIAKHPGIIGKKNNSKLKLPSVTVPDMVKPVENDEVEENDSDEQKDDVIEKKGEKNVIKNEDETLSKIKDTYQSGKYGLISKVAPESQNSDPSSDQGNDISMLIDQEIDTKSVDKKDDSVCDIDLNSASKNSGPSLVLPEKISVLKETVKDKKIVNSVKLSKKKENVTKLKNVDVYETATTEYCTWTPPSNQSGDGVTHLNAKYGY